MWPDWLSTPALRLRALLVLVMIGVLVGIMIAAWAALVPFMLGLIVAYIAVPIVDWIERRLSRVIKRRRACRVLSIVLVYLVAIGSVVGLIAYVVPIISEQARGLASIAPSLWEEIENLATIDLDTLLEPINPQVREAIDGSIADLTQSVVSGVQRGITVTITALSQTVGFILGILIVPIWLFRVLLDGDKGGRAFYAMIPDAIEPDVRCIVRIIDDLASGYVRGQLLLCFIVGALATIVMLAFGIEAALLLGIVAGILEVIPYIGPYLGAAVPVILALAERPIMAVWVALCFMLIQNIENMFLVPRISGRAVRFHPAVVMVIVIVGADVGGLWGVLLAVPLSAMVRDIYQYLFLRTTERGATPEMAIESLRARSS